MGKCTQSLFLTSLSPSSIASWGKGAKGVARSGFPPACGASGWLIGLRRCRYLVGCVALTIPRLDASLGRAAAMPKPRGLVARLHDVAVVGESIKQGRGHLGVNKNRRPLGERQIGGDYYAGLLVERKRPV
jgi:hypothetical protein